MKKINNERKKLDKRRDKEENVVLWEVLKAVVEL
jgi:hypothetical protein